MLLLLLVSLLLLLFWVGSITDPEMLLKGTEKGNEDDNDDPRGGSEEGAILRSLLFPLNFVTFIDKIEG